MGNEQEIFLIQIEKLKSFYPNAKIIYRNRGIVFIDKELIPELNYLFIRNWGDTWYTDSVQNCYESTILAVKAYIYNRE